ncbi:MAG: type II toxin-antitoxin system RelE/ParE family toxin [Thiotrichaceae bacterium]|nr:type II toxin-antitoxin system RelE/ParE family toxin [Thiotrichaceae bacterium]
MKIIRTKKAEEDIKEIYKYSFLTFGEEQAEKYYNGLEVKFKSILEETVHKLISSNQ